MKWSILPNSSAIFDLLPGSIQSKFRLLTKFTFTLFYFLSLFFSWAIGRDSDGQILCKCHLYDFDISHSMGPILLKILDEKWIYTMWGKWSIGLCAWGLKLSFLRLQFNYTFNLICIHLCFQFKCLGFFLRVLIIFSHLCSLSFCNAIYRCTSYPFIVALW